MEKCPCQGSFLERFIQPAVLLLLSEEKLHGFSIHKKLMTLEFMDYSGVDPTGLYRTLKRMEASGLLRSQWDMTGTANPRRLYDITEEGIHCLHNWQETLQLYGNSIIRLSQAIGKHFANR